MTDHIDIDIILSSGKACLSVADQVVCGPWTGQGTTVYSFKVSIDQLESSIANHKRKNTKGKAND